ncbi:unnamed protein product [Penicillium roqueforti FM164]|uniref:Genomic scaffold, ProqFM164S02 n=1 Tax=Penicillium roqueforti (strain FM164) TaxID=1365484 RepID=W6Q198_PENRF|nr:unnamed protein product [Penicillium roqueforti FM164]
MLSKIRGWRTRTVLRLSQPRGCRASWPAYYDETSLAWTSSIAGAIITVPA